MDAILKAAIEYRELGLAVHWLYPRSKAPVSAGWPDASIVTVEELAATYRPGYNVGFRPGKWSCVGDKEVVVLDVDVRGGSRYTEEAYAVAATLMGGKLDPSVISGSGVGRHCMLMMPIGTAPNKAAITLRQSDIYVSNGQICEPHVKGSRPAWVIELLSTGKNVVLPPSIHPDTGAPYILIKKD